MQPPITIHFQHKGEDVTGTIVEKGASEPDIIVVKPQSFEADLGYEIELVRNDSGWHSNAFLLNMYPDTFESLVIALEEGGY